MKLTLDSYDASYIIRGYSENSVQINNKHYQTSVIVSASDLNADWRPRSIQELNEKDLDCVLDLNPEVIILGTGKALIFPENEVLLSIYQKSLGVEVMDTIAACRTYNVLIAENRKVVAALIL